MDLPVRKMRVGCSGASEDVGIGGGGPVGSGLGWRVDARASVMVDGYICAGSLRVGILEVCVKDRY